MLHRSATLGVHGYAFGRYYLDLSCFRLMKDAEEVPVQPRVFDTLRYLVEHRHRVVRSGELFENVWAGATVTANALPWVISRARRALEQPSSADSPIRTVRTRGYQFTAAVDVVGDVMGDVFSAHQGSRSHAHA
jgi:DNA-binding winged helix-turn-helix (wHTH) protein